MELRRTIANYGMHRCYKRLCLSLRYSHDNSLNQAYNHTVQLPKTEFPMRADAVTREVLIQQNCFKGVYEAQREKFQDRPLFVVHDGPPFANGPVHMGHALNKILKDSMGRYQMMNGYCLSFIPGWDCHGLPIELKALDALNKKRKNGAADTRLPIHQCEQPAAIGIRELAKNFALSAIETQKAVFLRLGVIADWNNPYLTMAPFYEAEQLSVFYEMYRKGLIYRSFKPVYWSPSSGTALAEAELEYDNVVSRAVHVKFLLHPGGALQQKLACHANYANSQVPYQMSFFPPECIT